jgi:hypothetical protein
MDNNGDLTNHFHINNDMQTFTTQTDSLTNAAAAILFGESASAIQDKVKSLNEEVNLNEASIRSKYVRNIMVDFVDLDADELEELLFAMHNYFAKDFNGGDDRDFMVLKANLYKTANDWKRRKGN